MNQLTDEMIERLRIRRSMLPSKKKVIYLIDDEIELGTIIKLHLERQGEYDVEVFVDMNEPIEKIRRDEIPDLVITDLVLNKSKGTSLSSFIKNNPHTRHIPVLMMSGYFQGRNVGDAISAGCDDLIRKPFTNVELEQKIHSLLID